MNPNQYSANPTANPTQGRHANSLPTTEFHQSEWSPAELHQAVSAMLVHLRRESEFLDTVIECTLKMKDSLRRRSISQLKPAGEVASHTEEGWNQPPKSTTAHEQLDAIRGDLARQFLPIHAGRQQMESTLQKFTAVFSEPPTISRLAPKLDEPIQTQLKQMKTEIKAKLHQIQAINMGNQAVLIYTMDHYQQLFSGLSKNSVPSNKAYNADGRMTNPTTPHTFRKNC